MKRIVGYTTSTMDTCSIWNLAVTQSVLPSIRSWMAENGLLELCLLMQRYVDQQSGYKPYFTLDEILSHKL